MSAAAATPPPPPAPPAEYAPIEDQDEKRARKKGWCCGDGCTNRRTFNLFIALVVIFNGVVIAMEADLNLLGTGGRHWRSVQEDLKLAGYHKQMLQQAKAQVKQILSMDKAYEDQVTASVQKEMKANGKSMDDLQGSGDSNLAAQTASVTNDGAYTLIEYAFVMFYFLEWIIRICDQGLFASCCDGWMLLDTLILAAGGADLALPMLIKFNEALPIHFTPGLLFWTMSLLRLSRVSRIFRLLRLIPELRTLLWPYFGAFSVILKVAGLIFVIDFILAVLLTACVGQQRQKWGADSGKIDQWFGSIGRSLQTLVAIMTFNGWKQYADVLTEVLPGLAVVPALVLYTMLCGLAVIGIVTGAICDNFAYKTREADKEHRIFCAQHRVQFEKNLHDRLARAWTIRQGYVSRSEFEQVLEKEWRVLADMKKLDPDATIPKCMDHFDKLIQNSTEEDPLVKVDQLAEMMANQAGTAQASAMMDIRTQCRNARRENLELTKNLKKDVSDLHREALDITKKVHDDQGKLQSAVRELQLSCNGLRLEFDGLCEKMQKMEKREEADRRERTNASDLLASSMSEMTGKVRGVLEEQQTGFNEKIDALNEENNVAAESVVEMKKQVRLMPKQIQDVTRDLEAKVEMISAAALVIAKAQDVDMEGPSDDELEEMRDNAAIKIQCMTRQHFARKKVNYRRNATWAVKIIQKWARGKQARKRVAKIRKQLKGGGPAAAAKKAAAKPKAKK